MLSFEKKIIDFFRRHLLLLVFVAVTVLSLWIRLIPIPVVSDDMRLFLLPWMRTIRESGGLQSLSMPIGDYGSQYMFLFTLLSYLPWSAQAVIKSISIFFDFAGAAAAALLVVQFVGEARRKLAFVLSYTLCLCLPTVLLNSAVWGQCDFMYTTFLLLWLVDFTREKYTRGMIWFALAFCFKLQTIFFLPALLVFYFVSKKFSILHFLLIPATYVVTALPAVLFGKPFGEAMLVYFKQVGAYTDLTMYCPNIYYWFPPEFSTFRPMGVLLTVVILAIGCLLYATGRKAVEKIDYLWFTAWSAFTCVMFLPSMHERYFFPVEIVLVVWALATRRHWQIPALLLCASTITYVSYLFGSTPIILLPLLGFITLGTYLYFSWCCFSAQIPALKSFAKRA